MAGWRPIITYIAAHRQGLYINKSKMSWIEYNGFGLKVKKGGRGRF